MTRRSIETSIDIRADAGTVWQVLTDFSAYPDWNPFIRRIDGEPAAGSRLSVMIQPPGQNAMRFRPRVQAVERQRAFSWLGNLLMPGLFDGRHEFTLVQNGQMTRFHHREIFSGLLVPLVWNKMQQPTRAGFEAMNKAIKERAEAFEKE